MYYADTSALVKLVLRERESDALRAWVASGGVALATSDVARTELLRAVRRAAPAAAPQARDTLSRILLVRLTPGLLDEAGRLDPPELRSLDAVHLASALALGDDLEGVVAYDERMASAAIALGLRVLAPA